MIDSQVMGLEAVLLMEKEALMEQDQLGLQAMALDQTVGIPALVLLTDPEAQAAVQLVAKLQAAVQLVAKLQAAVQLVAKLQAVVQLVAKLQAVVQLVAKLRAVVQLVAQAVVGTREAAEQSQK